LKRFWQKKEGRKTRLEEPGNRATRAANPPFILGLIFLSLIFLCSTSRAELSPAAFEAANKLYEQGKFTEAASAYEKQLESGQASTALYFNLGNAWFKAGQVGRAIVAYHNAQAISPRDPDVLANLQFARNQVSGPTGTPSAWERWLGRLSLNEWTGLAAGSLWLCFLLLILQQWRPALKPALRNPLIGAGLIVVTLCSFFGAALYQNRVARPAVVIIREAALRHAPIEESPAATTVHDGAELRILDRKDDWLQVRTDALHIGWVRRDQVLQAPRN
jgi:tetratricopeptide (TPR) repeat protein